MSDHVRRGIKDNDGDEATERIGALFGLLSGAPGAIAADKPERHHNPSVLAPAIGEGLAKLHSIEVGDPLAEESSDLDSMAADLDEQEIDPAAMPAPYGRYSAAELVGFARAPSPVGPELVWGHGSPTLDQFLIVGEAFACFAGGRTATVIDRHIDLAIVQLGVAETLGAAAVLPFYSAYGDAIRGPFGEPNLVALDRAMLIVLLGRSSIRPAGSPEATGDR